MGKENDECTPPFDRSASWNRSRHALGPLYTVQERTDMLVKAGVKAILNYAPISLNVPEDVRVQHTDPVTHLQRMTYYL